VFNSLSIEFYRIGISYIKSINLIFNIIYIYLSLVYRIFFNLKIIERFRVLKNIEYLVMRLPGVGVLPAV
jgi:hypothetical protein